jgi:ADP-ribosyl-[dinitrogen reductase] hydrolase
MNDLLDRYRGCLLGLACGDAVGTTVEFSARGSFEPVADMVGGGPFELAAGQWTDDTSMALCLATSLVERNGFDATDQMNRYVNWWQWGYLSATGECFDIGMTAARALQRYLVTKDPMAGSSDPASAGNGSLMRLAPIVLFFHPDVDSILENARRSSQTTHGAVEAVECCEVLAEVVANALSGVSKPAVLRCDAAHPTTPKVRAIARGDHVPKTRGDLRGSGYCVESLEAALWCFAHTTSFEAAVLAASNLGDDADTTAAITGQVAGAFYGSSAIPEQWLARLHMRDEITRLGDALHGSR